jgi:hypothetical protein
VADVMTLLECSVALVVLISGCYSPLRTVSGLQFSVEATTSRNELRVHTVLRWQLETREELDFGTRRRTAMR